MNLRSFRLLCSALVAGVFLSATLPASAATDTTAPTKQKGSGHKHHHKRHHKKKDKGAQSQVN